MDSKNANRSIECGVVSCKNHCGWQDFCSLDKIKVGTHEPDPTVCECVDCESFEAKDTNR